MKWLVRVIGDEYDIRELAKSLNLEDLSITKESDGYYLSSPLFEGLTESTDVRQKAKEIMALLNGAARLEIGIRKPMEVECIVKICDDGRRQFDMILDAVGSSKASVDVVIRKADGSTTEMHAVDRISKYFKIALNDSKVAEALNLLQHDLDWVNLYRIYEVIEEDVGNKERIVANGWATGKQIKRFKHTACSPGAAGELARHTKETTQPPKDPMTLLEAKAFIESILHNWLYSKT